MRPYLQPDEIEPFLAACAPAHRIRSGLILETGLRVGEATHLRWAWIQQDVGRPALRVSKLDPVSRFRAKGKRVRVIPLSARAQVFLAEAAERWGKDGFVLHDLEKAPGSSNWCDDTHTGCKRGGVTDTHGLRRTAGVLWLASDLDICQVSRLLGHASVVTTEKSYAGVATSKWASIFDNVDARSNLPALPVSRAAAGKNVPVVAATRAATKPVLRRRSDRKV
jgi:integrase